MSKSYKGIRAKKNRVYSVSDVCELYGVCPNTVTDWIKMGLEVSDESSPFRFRGQTLTAFHLWRRAKDRRKLGTGEFYCFGCKTAVLPEIGSIQQILSTPKHAMLRATCPECDGVVTKLVSAAKIDLSSLEPNPDTSGSRAHEAEHEGPVDTVIKAANFGTPNDRILYKWQSFAGKYSDKTMDRHLAAIRWLEDFVKQKRFDRLTTDDVAGMREHLKCRVLAKDETARSKSTVQHTASHIAEFLAWLITQEGFQRLPRDLPSYIQLPRHIYAKALSQNPKEYPSLDEAQALLQRMPRRTIMQRRDRAIFAIAFLGALRADTLISLRLRHVDLEHKRITQNGAVSRTKNGKSIAIVWFPLPADFGDALAQWITESRSLGFDLDDALFPENRSLLDLPDRNSGTRLPIPVMRSTHAVRQAFKNACAGHHTAYSPHSAKHTIAAERDNRQLTREERKAWSENMGHESERITEAHYGKLSDERRFEVLENIADGPARGPYVEMSDRVKIQLVDAVLQANGY